MQELLVNAVADAPDSLSPVDAVAAGLEDAAVQLQERREFARRRQRIIAASTELRERELVKLASMAAAVADALRGRGVGDPAASLTAEVGIAVFRIAVERWTDEAEYGGLSQLIRDSLEQLKAVTADL